MTSERPGGYSGSMQRFVRVEEFKPSLGISILWTILGTVLVFVGLFLFSLVYSQIGDGTLGGSSSIESTTEDGGFSVTIGIGGMLPVILLVIGMLIVHEAIHGVAFWFFGGRPQFGAAVVQKVLPVLYCTAPGYRFTRIQFSVIVLAPLIVISLVGIALMPYIDYGGLVVIPLALNFAGAIGDVWMFGMLLVRPSDVMIEDLKDGLRFHFPASPEPPRG